MNWTLIRRGLIVAGVVYLVALIPATMRPSWSNAPLKKPDQTITVAAVNPHGALPPTLPGKLKSACQAVWILRPVVAAAKTVRVLSDWQGKIVDTRVYLCDAYTK